MALAGLALAAVIVGCKKEDKVELPSLTTLSVTNISYNSAKSGGSVTKDGGAEIILKGLVWSNQNNPTLEQNAGMNSQGSGLGSFAGDLAGLNPDITYYVRAYATNSKGTAYGNQQTFKTLPISVADVLTGQASSISFNSATCSGEIGSDGGTIVTSRGLCWNTSEQPTVDNNKIVLGSGTGSFSGSLTGLTAATVYYVRAYGTNSQGTAYGNQQTFTTLGVPYPILTTKAVTNITSTAATTGGNVTNDNGYNVTSRGVCWNTQPNPTTANNKTSDGSGLGEFTSNVINLMPSTTYYVRAYAINTEGTGYGNEHSFTTPQSFAPLVSTNEVTNITYTTATSGGMVTNDNGFQVTARGICFGQQPNPTLANSFSNDGSGVGPYTSYLTGLTQNTTYYVRAYATNSQGTAYGNEVTFSTLQVYTPTVITIDVTSIYATRTKCGGNVTADGGAPVTARGVCWSTSQSPTIANNKTVDGTGTGSFESQLTGLSGSTNYYVRAYATNSAGTNYGYQVQFTTLYNACGSVTSVTDIDGNTYGAISIGNQCWMQQNLKTTKYRNGSNITYPDNNNSSWSNNTTGAYAWYNNDIANKSTYAALYNWYAVNNSNKLCPTGWHVPTDSEWTQLVDYVVAQGFPNSDIINGAGNALKSCRQVSSPLGGGCNTSVHPRWNSHSTHYGFDEFMFSAFPGGYRNTNGSFFNIGSYGYWWSSTEYSSALAWGRSMYYGVGYVNRYYYGHKTFGLSVRCLRD